MERTLAHNCTYHLLIFASLHIFFCFQNPSTLSQKSSLTLMTLLSDYRACFEFRVTFGQCGQLSQNKDRWRKERKRKQEIHRIQDKPLWSIIDYSGQWVGDWLDPRVRPIWSPWCHYQVMADSGCRHNNTHGWALLKLRLLLKPIISTSIYLLWLTKMPPPD